MTDERTHIAPGSPLFDAVFSLVSAARYVLQDAGNDPEGWADLSGALEVFDSKEPALRARLSENYLDIQVCSDCGSRGELCPDHEPGAL